MRFVRRPILDLLDDGPRLLFVAVKVWSSDLRRRRLCCDQSCLPRRRALFLMTALAARRMVLVER